MPLMFVSQKPRSCPPKILKSSVNRLRALNQASKLGSQGTSKRQTRPKFCRQEIEASRKRGYVSDVRALISRTQTISARRSSFRSLTCRKLMAMKTLPKRVSTLSPPRSLSIAPWLLAASILPVPLPMAFSWAFPTPPSNWSFAWPLTSLMPLLFLLLSFPTLLEEDRTRLPPSPSRCPGVYLPLRSARRGLF